MGRRQCNKIIPPGDIAFALKARQFADGIARDRGRFYLSPDGRPARASRICLT